MPQLSEIENYFTMLNNQGITRDRLIKIQNFLTEIGETNEDTEFNPSQEAIVDSIIELVNEQGKTSIIEDFNLPYIHPMITVQKWNKELKDIVDDILNKNIH